MYACALYVNIDFLYFQLDDEEMFSNNLTNDDPGTELSMGTEESNSRLVEEVRLKDMTITQLRSRLLHLEKARMDKVPIDAAREIARLHATLVRLDFDFPYEIFMLYKQLCCKSSHIFFLFLTLVFRLTYLVRGVSTTFTTN